MAGLSRLRLENPSTTDGLKYPLDLIRKMSQLQVEWGKISMVDAERRLLANALKDPDNQQFVLLSDR